MDGCVDEPEIGLGGLDPVATRHAVEAMMARTVEGCFDEEPARNLLDIRITEPIGAHTIRKHVVDPSGMGVGPVNPIGPAVEDLLSARNARVEVGLAPHSGPIQLEAVEMVQQRLPKQPFQLVRRRDGLVEGVSHRGEELI
jgi:hypothetical protein